MSWEKKKVGDILTLEYGKPLDKNLRAEDGKYPAYGANGVKCRTNEHFCSKPTIIVGRKGSAGEITLTEEKFWPLDVTFFVKFDDSLYNLKFIYYLLKWLNLPSLATGVKPGINRNVVYDIDVLVPELDEQVNIATTLDAASLEIDKVRVTAKSNLENTRELLNNYLNGIFFQNNENWKTSTIGEIGKVSMCKRILKKQTSAKGDIPFYKIGTFGKKPDAFIDIQTYEEFRRKYSFPKVGDILLSASGTIGRRVIYDGKPAYFQDSNIVWIDNDESEVLNSFLYHFYSICNWNPSTGATISRLYNDDLRRIKISYPDKHMQKSLVENIVILSNETKKVQTVYERKTLLLQELQASILQKAFSIELTNSKGAAA